MAFPDLAEKVEAYMALDRELGEKPMSNADLAAELADNYLAQGVITEAEVDQAIFELEKELPYYTGRKK